MHHIILALSTVAGLLFSAASLSAQPRFPIKINRVQVGLPAGPFSSFPDEEGGKRPIYRAGSWAPVWVDVECVAKYEDPLEIIVETKDGDDIITIARVPLLPKLELGEKRLGMDLSTIPYIKPGHYSGAIDVSIRTPRGKTMAEPRKRSIDSREQSGAYIVFSVGASLNGLWLSKVEGGDTKDSFDRSRELRGGQVQLCEAVEMNRLPDQWIGYQGIDLVVLTTGANPGFWDGLGNDRRRMTALAEWVRRGGRLIVSAGSNADLLLDDQMREIRDMLPATIVAGGKRTVDSLKLMWSFNRSNFNQDLVDPNPRGSKIAVAALQPRPDRSGRALVPTVEGVNQNWSRPLVVQGTFGLGKVTIVGFDIDKQPMTDWEHRGAFWEWILTEGGHRLPSGPENRSRPSGGFDESEDLYVTRLQETLDSFEGVPVVSFGWVALFILLYILLIGPVDYFFLKKIVKRMEWTWVTFPIIVVAVSAIAYFSAYALKGRDLKINKIDLVDIDLQSNRLYGHTWFTIFSPRIQSYSVGVEPAGPQPGDEAGKRTWTSESTAETLANSTVSWFGHAKSDHSSSFPRNYVVYSNPREPDKLHFAAGLEQVPIQVWSTKAFTGSWSAKIDPSRPLFEHTLRHARDNPDQLVGTVTSRLPPDLVADAYLLYRDKAIPLGKLVPDVERTIIQKQGDQQINTGLGIVNEQVRTGSFDGRGRRDGMNTPRGNFQLWALLFHEKTSGAAQFNASLRNLDQSWRVSEQSNNHAILVLRVPNAEEPAEKMSQSPQSPTRLWANAIPGGPTPREKLNGTLRQETYVRVFIPIPNNDKK